MEEHFNGKEYLVFTYMRACYKSTMQIRFAEFSEEELAIYGIKDKTELSFILEALCVRGYIRCLSNEKKKYLKMTDVILTEKSLNLFNGDMTEWNNKNS